MTKTDEEGRPLHCDDCGVLRVRTPEENKKWNESEFTYDFHGGTEQYLCLSCWYKAEKQTNHYGVYKDERKYKTRKFRGRDNKLYIEYRGKINRPYQTRG